ncbi:RGG repeats nuclear RNA binding protein A-like [Actinidia eriantha]|uniref:RGG repeats nuclear RNA binding protein A-like n=1 Tax=Actinidia eriantha TaxID=165200 RepID=UPI0025843AC1|nr:RGG repeats nuclear RNA binding protein A-like [Actinidia eriantha]
MATTNPFDLLGDDDNDDPSQLIAAQQKKVVPATKKAPSGGTAVPAPKMPSKPLPPSQAVREAKKDAPRGGGRGGGGRGFGRGRGGGGFNRDLANNENNFSSNNGFSGGYKPAEDGDVGSERRGYGDAGSERRGYGDVGSERRGYGDAGGERRGYGGPRGGGGFRGGRRGGFSNEDVSEGERTRRPFERRSGTGRGNEIKRDGAGRGNWGTPADEIVPESEEPVNENEKNLVDAEKQLGQEDAVEVNKENPVNETEEKEPENKEMTLEEYEKVREEKRKALLARKSEERKVSVDKDLEAMQLLSSKKSDDEVFVKLGSDKDKRKDAAEKEERAKKSVSINEFLKPADGGRYRGRGRGNRSGRGGFNDEGSVAYNGGFNRANYAAAPSIDDVGQFPSLGAK